MRAEVKRWWSSDLPDTQSLPTDPDDCCVGMQADIGPIDAPGGDTFSFEVCTPSALATRLRADERPCWGHAMLIVSSFSWENVEAALNQYVRSISGDDWPEIASKLGRFMSWEFEDYQPYEGE